MPVLFLGHGSPMNAIEDNEYRRAWQSLSSRLPRPRAIVVVSAHWETRGVAVTSGERPVTIHDFGGFPQALFDARYPAPGDPALAARIATLLAPEPVRLDGQRGFDHGTWSVLLPMYPEADIPVVQVSLDTTRSGSWHYAIAHRLAPLRDEGVMIVASGDIVHNLGLFDYSAETPLPWAARFDSVVKDHIVQQDHAPLCQPGSLGADARLAIPTPEHYVPLLYALGVRRPGEPAVFFNDRVIGSLSMTSFALGA